MKIICCVCRRLIKEKPGEDKDSHTYCFDCMMGVDYQVNLDLIVEAYWTSPSLAHAISKVKAGNNPAQGGRP